MSRADGKTAYFALKIIAFASFSKAISWIAEK
jgi:hypothetical protein